MDRVGEAPSRLARFEGRLAARWPRVSGLMLMAADGSGSEKQRRVVLVLIDPSQLPEPGYRDGAEDTHDEARTNTNEKPLRDPSNRFR